MSDSLTAAAEMKEEEAKKLGIIVEPGGTKHDDGKPMVALVPPEGILAAARAMTFGEGEYGAHNWRKGLTSSRLASALMRHLLAFLMGKEADDKSGLSHLDHLCACALMLTATVETRPELDDRYKAVGS